MGANHAHGGDEGSRVPASRGAVVATLAVLVPLAVATLAALVLLWPGGRETPAPEQTGFERVGGTITAVVLEPCGETQPGAPEPHPATCGKATITVDEGGGRVTVPLPSGPGSQRFAAGDDVVLLHNPQAEEGTQAYQLSDHDRSAPLLLLGAAFALAVIAFGRWRGLTALAGLAITFVLLLTFVIPGILAGEPPMLIAIVGSSAIMLSVLFLTHGFTLATSMAVLGTLASLAVTGVLSYAVIGVAKLSGITDDSSFTLDMSMSIDTQGLLLASIMIGALGVLDDVTVTQSVTVSELAAANPSYGFRRLYRAGSRIGRAHIASVINTIILAYAGASLPLLLLFSIGEQPLGEVLTTPVIAQEVARSVVGTLGLISAVPITTALAALVTSRHAGTPPEAVLPPGTSSPPDSTPLLPRPTEPALHHGQPTPVPGESFFTGDHRPRPGPGDSFPTGDHRARPEPGESFFTDYDSPGGSFFTGHGSPGPEPGGSFSDDAHPRPEPDRPRARRARHRRPRP